MLGPPASHEYPIGANSSSLSMSGSSWRGGWISGGGGGGGGGLGMATCCSVVPSLCGSGWRSRGGVTATGTQPRSPASISTHVEMSLAVTSAAPPDQRSAGTR